MSRHPATCRISKSGIALFLLINTFVCLFLSLHGSKSTIETSQDPRIAHNAGQSPQSASTKRLRKPPFTEYVQGWNITKDVSWLLNFAIVAFPKTGTSTLMLYLKNHTNTVTTFEDERCEIGFNQHVQLLRDLYQRYDPKIPRKLGIKCPRDLENQAALKNYDAFFRPTKFVVGLRHPILWFESFYNFRIQNGFPMPPPGRLIGSCKRASQGVCTNRANFAHHLRKIQMPREVFLYEVSQLYEPQFPRDLGRFLDLRLPLHDPMIHVKPGRPATSATHAAQIQSLKIDICRSRYAALRERLAEHAKESAEWIQNEFLKQPTVTVSSPERFAKIMESWQSDPCASRGTAV